jgi:hypothetical protein
MASSLIRTLIQKYHRGFLPSKESKKKKKSENNVLPYLLLGISRSRIK